MATTRVIYRIDNHTCHTLLRHNNANLMNNSALILANYISLPSAGESRKIFFTHFHFHTEKQKNSHCLHTNETFLLFKSRSRILQPRLRCGGGLSIPTMKSLDNLNNFIAHSRLDFGCRLISHCDGFCCCCCDSINIFFVSFTAYAESWCGRHESPVTRFA